MKDHKTISQTGLIKGDRIHFTQKSVEADFIWEALEDYPAENIYPALMAEGLITTEESAYDLEESISYQGYVFPEDFTVLEAGQDPLALYRFTNPVEFEDLKENDILLIQGTKMSMIFPLTPESFQNLTAWATFEDMTPDMIFSMLVKGTSYTLFTAVEPS